MTILATGIGYLPQFRPTQRVCKHCGEPYLPLTRGDRYCPRPPCARRPSGAGSGRSGGSRPRAMAGNMPKLSVGW